MNKYIAFVVVGVLLLLGFWFLMNDKSEKDNYTDLASTINIPNEANTNVDTIPKEEIINNDLENKEKIMSNAILHTNKGDITIEFFDKEAPNTVGNFIKLSQSNFYDGVKFHRVIKGFMIQGGDPNSKDDSKMNLWGTGDPGYKFPDEINKQSALYTEMGYKKGVVAMANSGPNTNGSQFFIMHVDYPLPPLYTIFARVISGQEVVDKIANVATGANDRPIDPVIIKSVTLK